MSTFAVLELLDGHHLPILLKTETSGEQHKVGQNSDTKHQQQTIFLGHNINNREND